MQTYKIYKGPERVTIELSEDAVILKRCSGLTFKIDGISERLRPRHLNLIEKFGKSSANPDGKQYRCTDCVRECDRLRAQAVKKTPNKQLTCSVCGETKHHELFGDKNNSNDGKSARCRKCIAEYRREEYRENPEKIQKQNAKWRSENPDQMKDIRDAWKENNLEALSKTSRKRTELVKANRVEVVHKTTLLELHGNLCYLCGISTSLNISQREENFFEHEHIIPISRGGHESYANSRVSCRKCNGSKGSKTYWEVVIGWNGHWKNFSVPNLYLFNDNAKWHYEQIFKTAREAATNSSKEIQ